MSGALAALGTVGTFALPALSATGMTPAFLRNSRKVGSIIPDVTIEEQHSDRLQVTQHPVARGSPISDHAFKLPATVTMRLGWTNANPAGAAVGGFMEGGIEGAASGLLGTLTEGRIKEVYNKLLTLQYDAEAAAAGRVSINPFDLTTGKRTYKNMVIVELGVRTDHTTEYSLMIECHMQEVFIVDTQTTTQPEQSDQAAPQQTQATTPTPDQQPDPPKERTETAAHAAGNWLWNTFTGK